MRLKSNIKLAFYLPLSPSVSVSRGEFWSTLTITESVSLKTVCLLGFLSGLIKDTCHTDENLIAESGETRARDKWVRYDDVRPALWRDGLQDTVAVRIIKCLKIRVGKERKRNKWYCGAACPQVASLLFFSFWLNALSYCLNKIIDKPDEALESSDEGFLGLYSAAIKLANCNEANRFSTSILFVYWIAASEEHGSTNKTEVRPPENSRSSNVIIVSCLLFFTKLIELLL